MSATEAPLEELYSLRETQQLLGISRSMLFKLIRNGDLEVVRIAHRTLVEPATLRAFIAGSRQSSRSGERGP